MDIYTCIINSTIALYRTALLSTIKLSTGLVISASCRSFRWQSQQLGFRGLQFSLNRKDPKSSYSQYIHHHYYVIILLFIHHHYYVIILLFIHHHYYVIILLYIQCMYSNIIASDSFFCVGVRPSKLLIDRESESGTQVL